MKDLLQAALDRRAELIAALSSDTDCYRLFHGVAEGSPGVAVDRYGDTVLVQTWRGPVDDEAPFREVFGDHDVVFWDRTAASTEAEADGREWVGTELGLRFDVTPPSHHRGQDPYLFLDFRAARRWMRANAEGTSVLNLFAYTCGMGVAAAAGGATTVWNVDFAGSALEVGARNAALNEVKKMGNHREDVLPVMRDLAGLHNRGRGGKINKFRKLPHRTFDVIVLDPPRWSKGRFGAVDVARDYASLFKPCVLTVQSGGTIFATNHVPDVDRDGWVESLRRCAKKAGRELVDVELIEPEADFPSFDDNPPLKMAVCRL